MERKGKEHSKYSSSHRVVSIRMSFKALIGIFKIARIPNLLIKG